MTFIVLGICIGLALGFFSFYHLEVFLAGSLVIVVASGICLRLLALFSPIVAHKVSPTGEGQGYILDYLNMLKAFFELLPDRAQLAVFLLPVFIIIGRVLTWAHYTALPDSALPLTEAERRDATMNKFSLKRPRC